MKEASVLNVLMYLFHHRMGRNVQIDLNDINLVNELKSVGFHVQLIGKAFRWLNRLSEFSEQVPAMSAQSFRIFNEQECQLMDEECRYFILSLEQQGILTPHAREIVIHQTLELINEGVNINLIQWVTLMVLLNLPASEEALSHMEYLVLQTAH